MLMEFIPQIKRSKENGQSLLKQGSPVFIFMGRARLDLMVLLPSFEMMWELNHSLRIVNKFVKRTIVYASDKLSGHCQ